ncbi:unnamed protein product [Owenia fusiformis]|uniref:Uncharacterized protein n=1 Tax=Owenia fusiformis TaxID=6347 RepID=A0A8J1TTH0_OWEFU|nr:unnamed protein product [Owenia fusiformis]
MGDTAGLEKDAVEFAQRAVDCDKRGLYDTAAFYYVEAANALLTSSMAGSQIPGLIERANQYIQRAEMIKAGHTGTGSSFQAPVKTQHQLNMERAEYTIREAFDEDEGGNKDEAIELYMEAAEMFLKIQKESSTDKEKVGKLALQAIERAEKLKGTGPKAQLKPKPPEAGRAMPPLGFGAFADAPVGNGSNGGARSPSQGRPRAVATQGAGGYTKEEIEVLRHTSYVNRREYVPFMSVDVREKFGFPIPFTDKEGKLALSPKQKNRFNKWVRPDDFLDSPTMILAISSFSIKQTIVSDCSFVASVAISAQYERRFKKKLITSIIYPQNRQGEPQYNPCGKYMVKLNINGVPRKVIIDDYLPMSADGQLLCSYSNNRNELWVSLLEKAYLKVMGGYDFPGSNSNIDLHALTGWIPERIGIKSSAKEFDAEKVFKKIQDRFHKGHCLVTVATGDLTEVEADRAGLVPTHAYAMLDVREVKGQKLFMLKNPWSHLRWKGNFSEHDTTHWTPELQRLCNYDPKSAQQYDNGVFWIDYESMMKFYEVIYLNWNPDIFSHTTCMHHTWTAKDGPRKDAYTIGDNPQYKLEVRAPQPCVVWILLTRHITDKDDFADNREFITVVVYKPAGKKIFYPYEPAPYKDGVRINSPHYLCQMVEPAGTSQYTLVISQYEKSNTIHYTLRVYSTAPFSLDKIGEPYIPKYEKSCSGEWKGKTAGGCGNYRETYQNNPIYQVKIDNTSTANCILIELKGPKQYSVGFEVIAVSCSNPSAPGAFTKKQSGDFRKGFVCLSLESLPGGVYNIRPCTFYPGNEGPFILNISTNVPISLTRLQ